MVEQVKSYDKPKITVSNDAYINNNTTTKDFFEKYDRKVTKFNFDETREFSKTTKKTNGRSDVESLLKYSIELEKGRKTSSNEANSKVEEKDSVSKNIMDKRDEIQEISDGSSYNKIIPEYKCDGQGSDYGLLEDDFEDFITINPSGSVLAPSPNPYNKLDKIAEANLELTRSPPIKYSPTKVTFNDHITMLETSEDSESDDDSDGNESTTSADDSKLVSDCNKGADEECLRESRKIQEEPVEDVNEINPVLDESSIESVDDYTDNNSDDSSNKSVLLVKLPNTASNSEPLKPCEDISSESENEDVCVGHTKQDFPNLENTNDEDSLINKKVVEVNNESSSRSKDITSPEKNTFIIAEELSVEDVDQEALFATNYHEEYLNISETQAGITIKITCADSTDYQKSNNIVCKNDELFAVMGENHNISTALANSNSKKVSEAVRREETKKKVETSKSDVKVRESERSKNNSFSSRVRRKSVMHKKFLIKDANGDNNSRRKKEGKVDGSMNDSELLAERIFKSLCHNNELKNEQTNNDSRVLKQRNGALRKIGSAVMKSKSMDGSEKRKTGGEVCYCKHVEKERPKSSVVDRRRSETSSSAGVERPVTAPMPAAAQRRCCVVWAQGRLPDYNGLHSEYGLSAEQLQERKREKIERNKARKQKKEEKRAEEERKRKENEERFSAWLEKKREQEKMKMIQTHLYYYQPNRLHLKNFCAPTAHLIKIGAYRKKQNRKLGSKHFSVDKFLTNISPQEKRTYRIYLGLSPDD